MRCSQASRYFDAINFWEKTQNNIIKANNMQQNNTKSNLMPFISVAMQIAIIEAYRSEAIRAKEGIASSLE